MMTNQRPALYWSRQDDGQAICGLCPHRCRIPVGSRGRCQVRVHQEEGLVSMNYGLVTSLALDPLEKKPLYHFHPGREILSVGTYGCNLTCLFCQNWRISQGAPHCEYLSPEGLAERAARLSPESIGLAFTYNEPLVWYEYVLEACQESHSRGLKNVLVTNAFVNPGPWERLLEHVDAINADVKGIRPEFYRDICGGSPAEVLEAVEKAVDMGVHVEVTGLLVTGMNDSPQDVDDLASWLASLSPDIPLHLSRYFPNYRLRLPETPVETLRKAREVALKHLRYVYLGNLWCGEGADTLCYNCGRVLIERNGFRTTVRGLKDGACVACRQMNRVLGLRPSPEHLG